MAAEPSIKISIDRGGTFCDVIAQDGTNKPIVLKLLSEDPGSYSDAPTEAIRRVLESVEQRHIPRGEKLDGRRIASCRMGTTVATNALLQHKGHRFALVTTKGFGDLCTIGNQTRPNLFALEVKKAKPLHEVAIEVDERVTIADYDLNPSKKRFTEADFKNPSLVKTPSGEVVRVLKKPDVDVVHQQLTDLKAQGFDSVVISFVHSYVYPNHEQLVADLARQIGFSYVQVAHKTSKSIKFLERSISASSDAYLYPVVHDYIQNFKSGFSSLPRRLEFMCSDGGLKASDRVRGNDALVSGPAGGVVGVAASCYEADEQHRRVPLIGFDMGGTSTDVSRYDGQFDLISEARIASRSITAPMLNIATVAAGGGSILHARHGLLAVGPESAGAHPGPACYRKGGPLTVADANLFLGRLVVGSFAKVFGPNADQPLDIDVVRVKFKAITDEFNAMSPNTPDLAPEEIAQGFLDVANETMSRPIRNATEARGYAPEDHNLASFGGAGGQHACAIAEKLGIKRILIHKLSSVLSAYGISQADLRCEEVEPFTGNFSVDDLDTVRHRLRELGVKVKADLQSQGARDDTVSCEESLVLRYFGSDTTINVPKPPDEDYGKAFEGLHFREFAFNMKKPVVIDAIKVRGVGSAGDRAAAPSITSELESAKESLLAGASKAQPRTSQYQNLYIDKAWKDVLIYQLESIEHDMVIQGPALLIDETQTILVESRFEAYILSSHIVLERASLKAESCESASKSTPITQGESDPQAHAINPIKLSIFSHRFMSIAEQMGYALQRTSISTSIKERLDFSCAVLSPVGALVANAPHVPMQLGSMQTAVKMQHEHWNGKLKPGDALLTNHPHWGGLHLPDITIVTPMFIGDKIAFYLSSRGHHSDIGGKGITAMMPESKELWEEGFQVTTMKILSNGVFLEDAARQAFEAAGSLPGCSPTRRIQDNLSDLKAKISANQRGVTLLTKLCEEFGLDVVHRYMGQIQANAETAVRSFFRTTANNVANGTKLRAQDEFDDGSKIRLEITINPETGSAVYDFEGTSPHIWGNYNCPLAVTHSAVIYTTRCLVDVDIPLNEGCLTPIEIRLPENCILNPDPTLAVCGCTLASQRVIDTILRAYNRVAASQGCGNSFGWGMGGRDPLTGAIQPGWNYGESIGGGSGAGPGWHGESGVHVHSTNTRITDVEVIEKRTAVLVRRYALRRGSGGRGIWRGGDGIIREIEAQMPLRFIILSDSRVRRPYGMNGGGKGARGSNFVWKYDRKGTLVRIQIPGKSNNSLEPGERMEIRTPGGGGWGRPDGMDDFEVDDMPEVDCGLV